MANTPSGSSLLRNAYISRASTLVRQPVNPGVAVVDLEEFDRGMGESFGTSR